MFLQVKLAESDRWTFSFLWWTNERLTGDPEVFEWNVHPFGAKSSPFCANYALKCTPTEMGNSTTINAAYRNFYVDDYLASFRTESEAKTTIEELRLSLSRTHFDLTKWATTHEEVLSSIPISARLFHPTEPTLKNHCLRTLGIQWNAQKDTFSFQVSEPRPNCTWRTKR